MIIRLDILAALIGLECKAFQAFLLSNYFITKVHEIVRLFIKKTAGFSRKKIIHAVSGYSMPVSRGGRINIR